MPASTCSALDCDCPATASIRSDGMFEHRDADLRRHRTDGPAREHRNGGLSWHRHGLLHRTDGPAIEYPDGECSWWLRDEPTPAAFVTDRWLQQNHPNSTPETLALLHHLAASWPPSCTGLAELYAAATAATHP